jgi:hypothetical protein
MFIGYAKAGESSMASTNRAWRKILAGIVNSQFWQQKSSKEEILDPIVDRIRQIPVS